MNPIKNSQILIIVGVLIVAIAIGLSFTTIFQATPSAAPGPSKVLLAKKTIGVMRYLPQLEDVEKGFYKGMENLGYKEGKNVHYLITPYTGTDKAQEVAEGLVNQQVDMIVAFTTVSAVGAKKATEALSRTDIPIVFTHASSPDKVGLIKSFKSSGNNLTGIAIDLYDVTEKKLEFLRRINPSIKKIGILDSAEKDAGLLAVLPELKKSVAKFGMELVPFKVNGSGTKATEEIAAIAKNVKPGEIDAFFQLPGPVSNPTNNTALIIEMANRLKIPVAFLLVTQAQQGGLFAYAPKLDAMGEQTATFADKVLRGQLPSNIPVEFPEKNLLVLNLTTARASGITFPESMLSIADIKLDNNGQ